MDKEQIANICEEFLKYCLSENRQVEDGKLIWTPNGSTMCNILFNVIKIDDDNVNEEFSNNAYKFIRQPKGDIDICYTENNDFYIDFENTAVKEYQNISLEKRSYNFVDHNDYVEDINDNKLCIYETKNGLKIISKKPQYLFLYKCKELLAVYHQYILDSDLVSIPNKNILKDVKNLFELACSFTSKEEVLNIINTLPTISSVMSNIYNQDINKYQKIIYLLFENVLINEDNNLLDKKVK